MKKLNFTKILISVIVLILSMSAVIAYAQPTDTGKTYDESEYTIVNNVVYSLYTDTNGNLCYTVNEYGATKEIRDKMTEINIADQINGIPVKRIALYSYEDDYYYGAYNSGLVMDTYYPNVTKINIPDSVTYIGHGAFSTLPKIKSVALPKNLKELGNEAFAGLKNIAEITIPQKVTRIPNYTFKNCTNLKKITFEGDIKGIGSGAFYNCKNLEKISACENLQVIADEAFYGCSKIKSFNLPDTLIRLGYGAFAKTDLRSVTIPYKAKFTTPYQEDGEAERNTNFPGVFENCKNLKTVVFEDRKERYVISLTANMFSGCTSLETVVLPKIRSLSGISIDNRTFKNCTKLKTIVNSESIDSIWDAAFANCKSLKHITLSSKLSYIENKAFYGCSKLASVTYTGTKTAPDFKGKSVYAGTPDGIKFIVKNTTVAKKLKAELKNTGVKNAKIYIGPSYKLAYKNVK